MSYLEKVTETVMASMQRRMLFKRAMRGAFTAAAASAVAGTGLAVSSRSAKATTSAFSTATDIAILNFALNLEYLEASYYLNATTGTGLAAADTVGGDGTAAGTVSVPASPLVPFQTLIISQYADTIAADEQAHVRFLRSALGADAVAAPAIDVNGAFTTLALAAGLITSGQTFNPYASEESFLLGAYIFEDVGVTAYGGAANLIFSPDYLGAAASILAVEAYHAGTIRTLLAMQGAGNATDAISNLRSTLSAGAAGVDDFGTLTAGTPTAPGGVLLAPLDANALSFRRTTTQVLNIVYGSSSAKPGVFFPNGMSGTIK